MTLASQCRYTLIMQGWRWLEKNGKNPSTPSEEDPWQFRDQSVEITIPPLGMVVFKYTK